MINNLNNFFRSFLEKEMKIISLLIFTPHIFPLLYMIIIIILIYKYREKIRTNNDLGKSFVFTYVLLFQWLI